MIMVYRFASKKVGVWPYFGFWRWGYAGNWKNMVGYRRTGTIMVIASPTTQARFSLAFFPSTHYSVVVVNWCVWAERRCTASLLFNF